mmetsp:Transcript_77/g.174  ORF Transcript_77/g.174 Transcript_77/m.174 type:complete len:108 (-) Transcript_77:789-1112(-)
MYPSAKMMPVSPKKSLPYVCGFGMASLPGQRQQARSAKMPTKMWFEFTPKRNSWIAQPERRKNHREVPSQTNQYSQFSCVAAITLWVPCSLLGADPFCLNYKPGPRI